MGVPSKALCVAFIASVLVSGCAVSPSLTDANQEQMTSLDGAAASGGTDILSGDISTDEGTTPANDPSRLAVLETAELLTPEDTGSDVALQLEKGEGFSRFIINTGEGSPVFDVMEIGDPARLVIDLLDRPGSTNRSVDLADNEFLTGVRLGAHEDRTRLVFDMRDSSSGAEHRLDTASGKLMVTFLDSSMLAKASSVSAQLPQQLAANTSEPTAKPQVVKAPDMENVLGSLAFDKQPGSGGEVRLSLTNPAAFELRKTAPSEYVLTLPGVTAGERTTIPQITPREFPGIRSARAVQQGDNALVRMFVDPEVDLRALPEGNDIVVRAKPVQLADASARAQMKQVLPEEARAQLSEAEQSPASGEDEQARQYPTGVPAADGSKLYTGRLISLDLQDTDIDNALRIIAEVSNLNIIASDDVSGKVTLRLIDVPWDQALDVILKTNGLGQITEGNVIRIAPVSKLQQEAEARKAAKVAQEQLEDLGVAYIRISYARSEDLKEHVEGVLTERGTVSADDRTNQLIVRDTKRGIDAAAELIAKLDLRTPQVLLETQIVEGQRSILRDLGFQWNFSYIASPETGNATGYNFPNSIELGGSTDSGMAVDFPAVLSSGGTAISAAFDSADGSRALDMRLTALETEGKARVVSRPQVATINNKEAVIKSVETVRVRLPDSGTSVGIGTGASAGGGGSTAFEEIDVGIELTVTPQASPDYYVLLDVMARSSTFGGERVDNIPSTLEREATSTILVKSGQTFALGGVYRLEDEDSIEGVPWFKDIPFVGWLFRRQFVNKSDEELIFFITPHIVEGSFDSELMTVKEKKQGEEGEAAGVAAPAQAAAVQAPASA